MFEFIVAIIGFTLCMAVVARFGPHLHVFKLWNYSIMLMLPTVAVLILLHLEGLKILYVFIGSMLLGTFAEYAFGKMYHIMMGSRLWLYRRYSLGGYTSLLVTPLWGYAGVLFYIFALSFIDKV